MPSCETAMTWYGVGSGEGEGEGRGVGEGGEQQGIKMVFALRLPLVFAECNFIS